MLTSWLCLRSTDPEISCLGPKVTYLLSGKTGVGLVRGDQGIKASRARTHFTLRCSASETQRARPFLNSAPELPPASL